MSWEIFSSYRLNFKKIIDTHVSLTVTVLIQEQLNQFAQQKLTGLLKNITNL